MQENVQIIPIIENAAIMIRTVVMNGLLPLLVLLARFALEAIVVINHWVSLLAT